MKKVGWFLVFGLFLILLVSVISLASLIRADELQVTEEHPFLVNDSWIPAKELVVGDELLTIDGEKVRITEIEEVVSEESFKVYNLHVGGWNDFFAGGVLVHNKAMWIGASAEPVYKESSHSFLETSVSANHIELVNPPITRLKTLLAENKFIKEVRVVDAQNQPLTNLESLDTIADVNAWDVIASTKGQVKTINYYYLDAQYNTLRSAMFSIYGKIEVSPVNTREFAVYLLRSRDLAVELGLQSFDAYGLSVVNPKVFSMLTKRNFKSVSRSLVYAEFGQNTEISSGTFGNFKRTFDVDDPVFDILGRMLTLGETTSAPLP